MELREVISKNMMCIELSSDKKDEVIYELASLMYKAGRIGDLDLFIDDVNKREAIEVTALDNGVAIPHAQSQEVLKDAICIGKKSSGIEFGEPGTPPVKLVIMFAAGSGSHEHLGLLAKFARMLVYEDFVDELMSADTPDAMYEIILKYEQMICKK